MNTIVCPTNQSLQLVSPLPFEIIYTFIYSFIYRNHKKELWENGNQTDEICLKIKSKGIYCF